MRIASGDIWKMTSSAVVLVDFASSSKAAAHHTASPIHLVVVRRAHTAAAAGGRLYLTLRRALISSFRNNEEAQSTEPTNTNKMTTAQSSYCIVYVLDWFWFWFCRRDSFIETGDAHRLVFNSLIHPSFPLLKIQH
jgi:hypothetical protein